MCLAQREANGRLEAIEDLLTREREPPRHLSGERADSALKLEHEAFQNSMPPVRNKANHSKPSTTSTKQIQQTNAGLDHRNTTIYRASRLLAADFDKLEYQQRC